MLPIRKKRRELVRFGQQKRGLGDALTAPARQRQLDRGIAAGLPRIDGRIPASDKLALVLVYQPYGIDASTMAICAWLAAAGYVRLVVSDAPLLCDVVWSAVKGPNSGHDFCGNRDGLPHMRQWGLAPDELLILNNSIWLPVLIATDLLDKLSAHPADIAGTIFWTRGPVQFLESYLDRLNRRTLPHPSFGTFWAALRFTSNKYKAIRQDARGFSEAMRAAGLHLAGRSNSTGLASQIAEQDDGFLRLTLKHAAYIGAQLAAERVRMLEASGPDKYSEVSANLHHVMDKRRGYSTSPLAMAHLTRLPLLKKSFEPISRSWRLEHLPAVETGDLPAPFAAILAEIRAREVRT